MKQAYDSSGMTASQLRVLSDLADYGLVYRTSVSSPLSLFRSFHWISKSSFSFQARLIDLLPNTTLYYSHLISSSTPLDFTRSIRFPRFLSPRNQLQTLRVHFKPFTNRSHGFVCEFENEVCEFRYGDDYEGISEKGFGEWDYCESSKLSLSLSCIERSKLIEGESTKDY